MNTHTNTLCMYVYVFSCCENKVVLVMHSNLFLFIYWFRYRRSSSTQIIHSCQCAYIFDERDRIIDEQKKMNDELKNEREHHLDTMVELRLQTERYKDKMMRLQIISEQLTTRTKHHVYNKQRSTKGKKKFCFKRR